MCLIAFAYRVHPDYPLLLIGNRDEFLVRPTARAHWWEDHPAMFAGQDLKALGTWMGISSNGKFGVVTNFRKGKDSLDNAVSRGSIVPDYLGDKGATSDFLNKLENESEAFNPFNVLLGDGEELYYFSNAEGGRKEKLSPGIYGLSNNFLNVPWPKVKKARSGLKGELEKTDFKPESLMKILLDPKLAPDDELPNTGISYEWEKKLSAMFISMPTYGTRVSTLIVRNKEGELSLMEEGHYPKGEIVKSQINSRA